MFKTIIRSAWAGISGGLIAVETNSLMYGLAVVFLYAALREW
jgi:hypothetical protein